MGLPQLPQPIISPELWQPVQDLLNGRQLKRPKKRTHNFAFAGLITCGHCGCAFVGEIKKGGYIYYHCTGHKGKCSEPHTREEVLERKLVVPLKGISFSRRSAGLGDAGAAREPWIREEVP